MNRRDNAINFCMELPIATDWANWAKFINSQLSIFIFYFLFELNAKFPFLDIIIDSSQISARNIGRSYTLSKLILKQYIHKIELDNEIYKSPLYWITCWNVSRLRQYEGKTFWIFAELL